MAKVKPRTTTQIIEGWLAGQDASSEARDEAQRSWEAGQAGHLDYTDEFGQTFHVERYNLAAKGYIVVSWTDGGDVCFGSL